MKQIILSTAFMCSISLMSTAQVKIGHDAAGTLNSAAVLELSNNSAAAATDWKALVLPYVDFSDAATFPASTTWGIAGQPSEGAMVYNTGARITDGFEGFGVYVWTGGTWMSLKPGGGSGNNDGCSDPDVTPGSTGCVTFFYGGKKVTYATVRAADGKIWLQQNLGADRVAYSGKDASAYGDLFQWGRWDDGHQIRNSDTLRAIRLSPNDPTALGNGTPHFYVGGGTTANPAWWQNGQDNPDSWSGDAATATNGIDPCHMIGPDWHMPSRTEWINVLTLENITNQQLASQSNLKMPMAGFRSASNGSISSAGAAGNYWTATPDANSPGIGSTGYMMSFDSGSASATWSGHRGTGRSVRCVKD